MVGFEPVTIARMLTCDKDCFAALARRSLEREDSIKAFVKRLKGCLADRRGSIPTKKKILSLKPVQANVNQYQV